MKNKLLIIVLILVLFIIGLTIYKFGFNNSKGQHYFKLAEIRNFKPDDETDVVDSELYSDRVIKKNLLSIDYNFFEEKESIGGTIYIGKDKYLYITNKNSDSSYRILEEKFDTLYIKDYEYSMGIYAYAISEDYKVYIISLNSNDITKTNIYDYRYGVKFTNFVDIELEHDKFQPSNTVFVLSEDGKIYDINTGLRYDENVISLYDSIYVYNDNTMTNIYGYSIEDSDGNRYKIKYIFDTYSNSGLMEKNPIIIITQDNKFIYLDEDIMNVYEFNKKVKDINFDVYYPYVEGNLKVTFEDGYNVDFKASCNQYFCVNDFAE